MVTLPSALCTAQGALLDLGRLEAGETVLISAQPGTIERALISLATQIGAEVYVMAQNSNHEQILVESLGIDEDHATGTWIPIRFWSIHQHRKKFLAI
jgi:NADPH:quinone reductase-like Zn-dependent oxidoreductase